MVLGVAMPAAAIRRCLLGLLLLCVPPGQADRTGFDEKRATVRDINLLSFYFLQS